MPAGLSSFIDPAGEIWSVVMLSPRIARILASLISSTKLFSKLLKKGGSFISVSYTHLRAHET